MNTPVEAHSEPKPPQNLIDQRIGKYRVVRKLGEGGMGSVFEAVHVEIGQKAAVKLLKPELSSEPKHVQRFFDEAKLLSMVSNPGLIKIYDFDRTPEGQVYIVMELLEGETLWSRFEKREQSDANAGLPPLEVARVVRQVASALAAVHQRGIIHRDLKPENIFVVKDSEAVAGERAKILDFGIARLEDPSGEGRRTTAGVAIGTPTYMSPEQCEGSATITDRVDVYSLGVMSYELLTGAPPFTSDSMAAVLRMHIVRTPPALPPSIPTELAQLVMQMLAKEPKERPSMTEVAQRLEVLFGGRASSTAVPVQKDTASPRSRLVASAVGGVLLVGGIVALLLFGRKPPVVVSKPPQNTSAGPNTLANTTQNVTTNPPKTPDKTADPQPPADNVVKAKPDESSDPPEKKPGKGVKSGKPREPKDKGGSVVFGTKKTKKGLPL